jgi:hypothetical protein
MENTSDIVAGLQELQNQVKYFHWQTKSYSQHKALGRVFDSITELIDTFVETLMGKYGRPSTKGQKFEMFDFDDVNIEEWTGGVCDLLISFSDVLDDSQDTDLLNVRDEMLGEFNKLKYLLTLKENMKQKKVIKLTENDLYRIVKRVINEQGEEQQANAIIQCFLNKKGVKDDSGKPLVVDGSIGRLPNSKSAQAIYKYQGMIGVEQDGVWGYNTSTRMPSSDKKLYDACFSENSGIIDKLAKGISDFFN